MPTVKIRAQVLICPHRDHLAAPAALSWPRPRKARVVLIGKPGGSAAGQRVELGDTDETGTTGLSAGLEHGTYEVEVSGYELEASELELTAASSKKPVEVRLIPRDGHCLVPLHLTKQPERAGLHGASVRVTCAARGYPKVFTSDPNGHVYAYAPEGGITLKFEPVTLADGRRLVASDIEVPYQVAPSEVVDPIPVSYWPEIKITAKPTIKTPSGATEPLTGTSVTVEYRGSAWAPASAQTKILGEGSDTVPFVYLYPGLYVVTVNPPATFGGLGIVPMDDEDKVVKRALSSGDSLDVPLEAKVAAVQQITFLVETPQHQVLNDDLQLEVYTAGADGGPIKVKVAKDKPSTATVPAGTPLEIRLAAGTVPKVGRIPLEMSSPSQTVVGPPETNIITLRYENSITGRAFDESDRMVPGAVIDVLDENGKKIETVITNQDGGFEIGLEKSGTYFLAQRAGGGEAETFERVEVSSPAEVKMRLRTGIGRGGRDGEALTDLAAYPVLTEEISTTGIPAPSAGGPGSRGWGAGYGQTVDQVIRDVLGWRPGGDVASFRAALTGTFQLREVEGHTEWSWQQRGYAVQADMGALSGAQASIYARAKSALDQMLPLLAGLTTLNPALYPPQDLEAIRTVVTAELNELVSELALEGGPRIQRVDQLFRLLLGESHRSFSLDPDRVGGQLGILRDRFGLTVDEIDTVEEERIVTNFRVIIEQMLALQASWFEDRKLLSGVNSRTSLGTILILLSRGLEAVSESVEDLTFALDSVYVDAAQRQVIELRFAGLAVEVPKLPLETTPRTKVAHTFGPYEPPLVLSDLLDWVNRASRDEGPRIVQDAGKDGVLAFEPVLDKLRILIHATHKVAHTDNTLPSGMQTPRVRRALQVLAAQLDEAANLARLVRREAVPQIAQVTSSPGDVTSDDPKTIMITLTGSNFRESDSAVLIAENREDLADLPAQLPLTVTPPNTVAATFMNPAKVRNSAGTTWLVAVINENGTSSNQVEAVRVHDWSA